MKATATWEDGWWIITIPEVPNGVSQAKRLDQVPVRVAEVVELMAGIDVDPGDVIVDARYPGEVGEIARVAKAKRAEAKAAQEAAEAATAEALLALLATGLPQRDVGALLGITHQRVAQLAPRLAGIKHGRAAKPTSVATGHAGGPARVLRRP